MRRLAFALVLTSCLPQDDAPAPAPTCAELGCPYAPSATPDAWTACPAEQDLCWCWGTGEALECER